MNLIQKRENADRKKMIKHGEVVVSELNRTEKLRSVHKTESRSSVIFMYTTIEL